MPLVSYTLSLVLSTRPVIRELCAVRARGRVRVLKFPVVEEQSFTKPLAGCFIVQKCDFAVCCVER